MNIREDLIRGEFEDGPDGIRARRYFLAYDVIGKGSQRMSRVARASGIPSRGDTYPGYRSVKALSVNVSPLREQDASVFLVIVEYSDKAADATGEELSLSDPIEVSLTPYSSSITTFYDRHGDLNARTFYQQLSTNADGETLSSRSTYDVFEIEVERPGVTINITKTTSTNPDLLNKRYQGKINASQWNGNKPLSMRCEGFSASYTRNDRLFRVTGEFTRSASESGTWLARTYTLVGGIVQPTARLGNGIWDIEAYEPVSFARLGWSY